MQEENLEVTGEDENLNSQEEVTESSQEEEVKVFTAEEVEAIKKKMQADSEKGVQKLISEKKAYETVLEVIGKVSENQNYLVDYYSENPQVAQIILDKYYNGQSIDEFKTSIWYSVDYNDPDVRKKLIEAEAKKIFDNKLIEKSKSEFIEKLKMSPEEKKEFEVAFEERKQLRSFKIEDIDKQLEKAYREISDNTEVLKTLKNQETIAKSMATWEGKGGNAGETKKSGLQNEIADFLKTYA